MSSDSEYGDLSFPEFTNEDWVRLEAQKLPTKPPSIKTLDIEDLPTEPVVKAHRSPSKKSSFGSLVDFTEQGLNELDGILQSSVPIATTSSVQLSSLAPAQVEPTIEQPLLPIELEPTERHMSLFKKFRYGRLSVSDLVDPAWCEYKKEYDLRSFRSRGAVARPAAFTTADKKEITIDQNISLKSEASLQRGHTIHKALEREIKPIELPVISKTNEDVWAFRLLAALSCLRDLELLGVCREFPVFGLMHEVPILGVIDELRRVPIPTPDNTNASTSRKRKRTESDPSQTHLTFTPSPKKPSRKHSSPATSTILSFERPPRPSSHRLTLSDTKTRNSNRLPSNADSEPAKLQLMIYKNILDSMISSSSSFSWDDFFKKVDPTLNLYADLSDDWVSQALILITGNLMENMEGLLQARSIAELIGVWRTESEKLGTDKVDDDLVIEYRTNSGHAEKVKNGKGQIIGTRSFKYNGPTLEKYLKEVFEFWMGTRKKQGVNIHLTHRCNSCEYKAGCEWREEKAQEGLRRIQTISSNKA